MKLFDIVCSAIWGFIVGVLLIYPIAIAFFIIQRFIFADPPFSFSWMVGFTACFFPIGCTIYYTVSRIRELAEKKRRQQAQEQEAAQLLNDELEAKRTKLSNLQRHCAIWIILLKDVVPSVEKHLDKAEYEFRDGAYGPFWDEIENATNLLVQYQDSLAKIKEGHELYDEYASGSGLVVPKFELPLGELPDARPAVERLSQVVRQAQRDRDFALIFEQRKTNQLLRGGFGTLVSAIASMQASLTQSLEDVASSLNVSVDALVTSVQMQTGKMNEVTELITESMEQQRDNEAEVIEQAKQHSRLLENLQRGR